MGIFKKTMLSTAIVSMVAMPTVAAAAPQVRASAEAEGEEAVGGGAIVGVLAAAAVIAGIVIIADDGGDDDDSDSN